MSGNERVASSEAQEILPARPAHHEGDTELVVVPHFAIRDRDRRLLDVPFDELPTAHPYTLMLPQDETERLQRV